MWFKNEKITVKLAKYCWKNIHFRACGKYSWSDANPFIIFFLASTSPKLPKVKRRANPIAHLPVIVTPNLSVKFEPTDWSSAKVSNDLTNLLMLVITFLLHKNQDHEQIIDILDTLLLNFDGFGMFKVILLLAESNRPQNEYVNAAL